MDGDKGQIQREVRREAVGRRVAPGASAPGEFTYSVVDLKSGRVEPGPAPVPKQSPPKRSHFQEKVQNRRGEGRTKSHLREGFVAGPRRNRLVDCRIRDLSRGGARLTLEGDLALPQAFLLIEVGTQETHRATLAWQRGREAGVRLTPA